MSLENKYDAKSAEKKWQQFWQEKKIYEYDKESNAETYSIDTPPPTVSGKLHIGHVFSYTQAEVIARYHRMSGKNVMYPFGFDDNGLPTEILTEREKGVKGADLPRGEFIKLCQETSKKYRLQFKGLWQSLGFSCDWNSAYSTISESSQRISQRSFLDLLEKSLVEYKQMPTLWCTHCQTSFAQAEVEDVPKATIFNYLNFHSVDGEPIPIATTRPELLAGCVAMFIHPQNEKYKHLIGKEAIVPLFGHKVKIIADEKADPEKGTGIVMCCTFGDVTDIDWWIEHKLDIRICFSLKGKMNELSREFEGLTISQARKAIIDKLLQENIIFKQEDLAAETRIVNCHERCGTAVEYLNTKQWFIKVVENKEKLIAQGEKINWYPSYMQKRYNSWVENLGWDWAISRQRYFGVPIPVWYAPDGTVIPASIEQLPVNPLEDKPLDCKGYNPDELIPEADVLDTWATSSITPQLNSRWGETDEDKKIRPMSMRPQAHDIIRTWAFYTIVKSFYHFDDIPWKNVVVSGHVIKQVRNVDEQAEDVDKQEIAGKNYVRKTKISKSKDGDNFSPVKIIDNFGADIVRYWTCSGTLGTDIAFDETEILTVNKLLNKLWNCSRFAETFLQGFEYKEAMPELTLIDEWILARYNNMSKLYHKGFNDYEFFIARNELEKFFWASFCDNYLELIKDRLWNPDKYDKKEIYSTQWTLYQILIGQLKLFAPFIPHITEEIYQELKQEEYTSIHISPFVKIAKKDFSKGEEAGDWLLKMIAYIRTYKSTLTIDKEDEVVEIPSKKGSSLKLPLESAEIGYLSEKDKVLVQSIERDFKAITKINEVIYVPYVEMQNPFPLQKEYEYSDVQINLGDVPPTAEVSPIHIGDIKIAPQVLYRQRVLYHIKFITNELKQAKNLKSKSPIKCLTIYTDSQEMDKYLKEEPQRIMDAVKAEKTTLRAYAAGEGAQDVYNNLRISIVVE